MPSAHAPQAAAKTLILSPKDETMLAAFRVYRYLTALDVAHLGLYSPKSLTFVRERLSRLCGNIDLTDKDFRDIGYPLHRFGFPSVRGNRERIFCLSLSGRNIVESLGQPVSYFVKPAKLRVLSRSHLQHSLALNRFVIALTAWTRSKPNLTIEPHLSWELSKNPPKLSIDYHEQSAGQVVVTPAKLASAMQTAKEQDISVFQALLAMMKVAVIPDAIIVMTNLRTGQKTVILLEIDHNTQSLPRLRTHIAARLAYVQSPHFTKTYGNIPYRIAYVTFGQTESASHARLESMLDCTGKLLAQLKKPQYAKYFRFTTITFPTLYEDAQSLFEGPVWYRPDDPKTAVPLLTGENPQPAKDTTHVTETLAKPSCNAS